MFVALQNVAWEPAVAGVAARRAGLWSRQQPFQQRAALIMPDEPPSFSPVPFKRPVCSSPYVDVLFVRNHPVHVACRRRYIPRVACAHQQLSIDAESEQHQLNTVDCYLQEGAPFLMTASEQELLNKYLATASHYFEFGCGGSTYEAVAANVACITSIDSSAVWMQKVKVCRTGRCSKSLPCLVLDT